MTEEKKNFKQTEVGLIPEDWKLVKLEDLSELLGGYAFKSSNFKSSGKFQVVKMSNVYMNDLNLNRSQSYLDKIQSSQTDYLLKSGDIIISLTGTVGKEDYGFSYRLRDETNLLLNQRLAKVSAKPDISNVFLDFQLKTRAFLKQFYELGKGGTGNQTNVSIKNLAGLHIPLPPTLEEQQAIASALSDVDELIRSLDRLIEKKEAIKKGTMQQLLTGQKRLPGFDGENEKIKTEFGVIPKDWELISLEEATVNGGLIRGPFGGALKKDFFVDRGIKVYEQKNAIDKTVSLGSYYINEDKFRELSRFEIKPDDFIVSCSGTIGKIFRIPKNAPKGVINQALLIIRIDDSSMSLDYFNHYFSWNKFQERIIDNTHGGAMKNLVGMDKFRNTLMPAPATLEEQKAIAQILSDMDRELQTLRQKREKYRQVKQGMMQELLTGKVRLV